MRKEKVLKYLSFGTLALIILALMGATVLEKVKGTEVALSAVYHSPVVITLWVVCCISAIVLLVFRHVRSISLLLIHGSFLVILAGALISFCTSSSASLSLREGESDSSTLPFTVTLNAFNVEFYPGSSAPSDYQSSLSIRDGQKTFPMEVSMNHIGKYRGYRFYQSGADSDMRGTHLTVSHDPVGIAVTYTGYILLIIGLLLQLFRKGSAFRRAISRLSGVTTVLLCFLLLSPRAGARERHPSVVPADVAECFDSLYIYHNDRVTTFASFSRDYCLKVYGKSSYHGATASQVVTGWLFYYNEWENVPFKLKKKDQGGPVQMEKEYLFNSVASGIAFKFFPFLQDSRVEWYSCEDRLPVEMSYDNWLFIRKILDLVAESVRTENWSQAKVYLEKIRLYQVKTCPQDVLPSDGQVRLENAYNAIAIPKIPAMFSLTVGILLFILMVVKSRRRVPLKESRSLWRANQLVLLVLALYILAVLVLRGLLCGHLPMTNGFETMLVLALVTAVLGICFSGKLHFLHSFAFILCGFSLLVSSLGQSNPQLTQMAPVLNSPLLSLHVASMMISYSLLGLSALCGIIGLVSPRDASAELKDVSTVIICPAVFTLVLGTILGSIWANQSWGCYWGWDPKEVWSLVTILVYSYLLHTRILKGLGREKRFHLFTVLAFICVLITYFGVNLVLGGLHSYA